MNASESTNEVYEDMLKIIFPKGVSIVTYDSMQPLDDMMKFKWYESVEQRRWLAKGKKLHLLIDEALVQELKKIRLEYEKLLQAGLPQLPIYDEASIRRAIADILNEIANAYTWLNHRLEAKSYLIHALDAYKDLEDRQAIEYCRDMLANLEFDVKGEVDSELQRLRSKVTATLVGSLAHIEALIDLAQFLRLNGENFEAKELYVKAESELLQIADDPEGKDIAEALVQAVQNVRGLNNQQTNSNANPAEIMRVRGIYEMLYIGLAMVYQDSDPQLSKVYREQALRRHSQSDSQAFGERMSEALRQGLI